MDFMEIEEALLWFFGTVATIGGGVVMIHKGYRKYRDPIDNLTKIVEKNITETESRMEKLENQNLRFSNSLENLKEVQHAQAEATMTMLDHMATGNHTNEMQAQKKKLYSIVCRQRKDD